MRRSTLMILVGLVVGLLVGGGIAYAATTSKTVKVCVTTKNVVRSASSTGKCPAKTKAVSINKAGPTGRAGKTGAKGKPGAQGPGAVGINQTLSQTPASTGQAVYSDPLVSVEVVCTASKITVFYESSQDDTFVGIERTVLDGVVGTDTTDGYSSSGSAKGASSVALDATLVKTGSTDSRELDLTAFRSGNSCRVFGRITS